jgi:hypothetical protein
MKEIARRAGGPTDTSRDYEFTDWAALDRFVADAARAARSRAVPMRDESLSGSDITTVVPLPGRQVT